MERGIERGLLFVVSSPSGAGKTTLCRRLLGEFSNLTFSVSYTTRPMRPREENGVDYHFVDRETFDRMIKDDEFAEWAEVHGNLYGTSWQSIRDNVDAGRDVIFDIDWQGARALSDSEDTVMVFVLPPSSEELERRLRGRGTDSTEQVERRLAMARQELSHYGEYQYLVVNDDVDRAYEELRSIYVAQHCTINRRGQLARALRAESLGR
jgi:guanylate kinase